MTYIVKIIWTAFIAVFAENAVFSRGFGTNTLIRISKNRKNFIGFSVCVLYINAITSIICYFVNKLFVYGTETSILFQPLVYVTSLGVLYVLTLLVLWRFFRVLFTRMKKYIHISAFNSAVIGAMFVGAKYFTTLPEYLFGGISIGIGFIFAVYLVSIVYDRLYSEDVPYCFRGYPLLLIYIGIISMAFFGLSGYNVNY